MTMSCSEVFHGFHNDLFSIRIFEVVNMGNAPPLSQVGHCD